MIYYSVMNLLRIVIHYSKYSKSVQTVVIHYIFSSESVRVVNLLQIVNSLRVLFLVCRGPLGNSSPANFTARLCRSSHAKVWAQKKQPFSRDSGEFR